jgi:hypothetical protein
MREQERELPPASGRAALVSSFADGTDLAASPPDVLAGGRLLALLTLEAAVFVLASASGKMPAVVIELFRALLTL